MLLILMLLCSSVRMSAHISHLIVVARLRAAKPKTIAQAARFRKQAEGLFSREVNS